MNTENAVLALDRIEQKLERLRERLAAVEAERDAAQAGEARAVEALRRCHEGAARQLAEPRDHDNDQYALTAIATDCEAVLAAQRSALAWLDQQRREAAAAALEEFADDAVCMEKLITCNIFDLRSALRTRAAAIRAGEVPHE